MGETAEGSERRARVAHNHALFREVNERIADANKQFERAFPGVEQEWMCECGNASCSERLSLTLDEYERVRADGTHFLVAPRHVDRRVERAVEQTGRYWIVEHRQGPNNCEGMPTHDE